MRPQIFRTTVMPFSLLSSEEATISPHSFAAWVLICTKFCCHIILALSHLHWLLDNFHISYIILSPTNPSIPTVPRDYWTFLTPIVDSPADKGAILPMRWEIFRDMTSPALWNTLLLVICYSPLLGASKNSSEKNR